MTEIFYRVLATGEVKRMVVDTAMLDLVLDDIREEWATFDLVAAYPVENV